MIVDTWLRHAVKTGTWRVVAFILLAITSYLVTGSLALAGSIAAADWIIKSIAYMLHEWGWSKSRFGRKMTERQGCVVWFTGLSGSGKTTVADRVAEKLREMLIPVARLDGDVARRTFSKDLGFSSEDRAENCRRATHVASYLKDTHIVLASFISPKQEMRDYVEMICAPNSIITYVNCPIEKCAKRDPKGMYAKLEDGCFMGSPFTGMHPDAKYEIPDRELADLELQTDIFTVEQCADVVIEQLGREGYV